MKSVASSHVYEDLRFSIQMLEKIDESQEILNLMIFSLSTRSPPVYFGQVDLHGYPEAVEVEPRITE